MYNVTDKEFEAVSSLPGYKRYEYFIKIIVQAEEVWGLYDNGWNLLGSDENEEVFPFWPAKRYAEACIFENWPNSSPRAIPISELIDDLLSDLKKKRIIPGIFFVPGDGCVHVEIDRFLHDLNEELLKYGEGNIYWEREMNHKKEGKRNPIFPEK